MVEKRKLTKKYLTDASKRENKKHTFTFTIPDHLIDTEVVVYAAGFPIAIKPAWSDEISHKTGWCNNCGLCCLQDWEWELGTKWIAFNGEPDVEVCQYAYKIIRPDGSDGLECRAGALLPRGCMFRQIILIENKFKPACSLEYDIEYELEE